MRVGSQQFTSIRMTFTGQSVAAINMIWDWSWVFKDITVSNCPIGLDMTSGWNNNQQVGAISLIDSTFTNVQVVVKTNTSVYSQPKTSGSLIIENVIATNAQAIVQNLKGQVLLAGSTGTVTVPGWAQGQLYNPAQQNFHQDFVNVPRMSALLVPGTNTYVSRAKPQYEKYDTSLFVNVKSVGVMGDGATDDTQAIQNALNQNAGCKILFFPMGSYIVRSTITIPAGTRMVGQTWSQLMATGSYWADVNNPRPVFKLGTPGDPGVL
eukprot:TRINITY_DN7228_c0_g1_i1.p1 TRINITY_DN7228_c0_g1~~TRINITY_DN7228_c0_g1_i1.p1  ORF type:complete len:266 (-),score=75.10 TRINITY_DN7228_c0_g1_i1:4-801(-)